ncbi:O-antigen ligase family protein, partial [Lactobacillus crispatus]|uniref:O-antigen ligase family protein n=1 Tax=Lactobacillus crispatus TaxID=47770 RepID=UPI001238E787
IYTMATVVILLTRSRTALFIAIVLFFISIVDKYIDKQVKILIVNIIFALLALVPLLMLYKRPFGNNISMALRYDLWEQTLQAFLAHPILGNGLMAGRNLAFYNLNWFVQSHSTYFQLLCDNGIFALVLYFYIYYINIIKNINNPLKYIFLIYFAWSFTYETMYLTYTIIYFGILPYCKVDFKGDLNG